MDDEVQLIRTYELLFKNRGTSMAFTACLGREMIEKFRAANPRPGIVIIDYRLPDMGGLEVMHKILSLEPTSKVVFISGDEGVRQESLDAGATVFLKKPTSITDITLTINSLIKA